MKQNETRIKEGRFSPKLSAIHEIEIETYLKEKAKPPTFVYLKYIMDFAHLILQLIFFLCAVGATTVASVSLPEIDLRSSSNKYDVVIASIFPESGPKRVIMVVHYIFSMKPCLEENDLVSLSLASRLTLLYFVRRD